MGQSTDRRPDPIEGLQEALGLLEGLGQSLGPTSWIAGLEVRLRGTDGAQVRTVIEREGFGRETLDAALLIKRVSAQIDVLVHAIGILNALPYILEAGEVVESLSLGAGNTGRAHDLETDRRVAEFKFTGWRGGSETIRQNSVVKDLFNLVSNPTNKRRVLCLVGTWSVVQAPVNRVRPARPKAVACPAERFAVEEALLGQRRRVSGQHDDMAHVVDEPSLGLGGVPHNRKATGRSLAAIAAMIAFVNTDQRARWWLPGMPS